MLDRATVNGNDEPELVGLAAVDARSSASDIGVSSFSSLTSCSSLTTELSSDSSSSVFTVFAFVEKASFDCCGADLEPLGCPKNFLC